MVSRGHTLFCKRGKGNLLQPLVVQEFTLCKCEIAAAACCTGIYIVQMRNWFEKTDIAAACGFPVDLHLVISY